jgi:hypothetical protein
MAMYAAVAAFGMTPRRLVHMDASPRADSEYPWCEGPADTAADFYTKDAEDVTCGRCLAAMRGERE